MHACGLRRLPLSHVMATAGANWRLQKSVFGGLNFERAVKLAVLVNLRTRIRYIRQAPFVVVAV